MAINTLEYRKALEALSRNNSTNSSSFNWLLAVLEWAEWDITLREKISKYLEKTYTPIQLPKNLSSIREKVAFIASETLPTWGDIVKECNELIDDIHEEILKKQDLSESRVIRNSALNRFEVKISLEQQAKLNKIENDLREIIEKRVPDLLPNLNSKNETIAQRIQKIKEIISFLIKNNLLDTYPDWFGEFEKLLNPLHELDKKYHELNHSRNTFYDIQRWYWEIVVLNSNEKNKLNQILMSLCWSNLEDYFKQNIQSNLLNISLPSLLQEIKSNNIDIDDKLKQFNLKISDFDRYFMFYFATEILKTSKINLDKEKKLVFNDKLRDFESDVKNWREIQRNRLILLCRFPFSNINDIENIFDRDRKLFLRTWNTEDDKALREWLLAVLEHRYTETPENIREQLANAIMNENVATNELYYWHNSSLFDDRNEIWHQNFFKSTWNAWRSIQKISQHTTPILWWFVNFTRRVVELSWWAVASVITWTTWWVRQIMWNYNSWAGAKSNSFLWAVVKFPFKLSQIITRPLWWWVAWVDILANTWVNAVSWSYSWINNALNTATRWEINNLFDIFTKTYKHSVNLLWSWVAYSWDKTFDLLKTDQKRAILQQFYISQNSSAVNNLLESIDMQSRLKDSSPYVFDDISDNLWYEIKESNNDISENIKLFSEKLEELLKWLNKAKAKAKDQEIYDIVINSFDLMNDEINSSKTETEKFKSIVAKIKSLVLLLKDKAKFIKKEKEKKEKEREEKENQIRALLPTSQRWLDSLSAESRRISEEIDKLNARLSVLSDLWLYNTWFLINDKFMNNLKKLIESWSIDDWVPWNDYVTVLNIINL